MNYDWNKNVNITVPVGLNGWYFSGEVTINGVKVTFPVGKPTTVPEPVAEMLKAMIKAAMPNTANPHYEPHKMYVTDENGDPVWTDLLAYKTTGTVEYLKETDITANGVDDDDDGVNDTFFIGTPWPSDIVTGKAYTVTFNGTAYECEGIALDTMAPGTVLLGNYSLVGETGGNEDAPFLLFCVTNAFAPDMGGVYGIVLCPGATSVVVSVTGEGETIKRLDPDLLPAELNAALDRLVANAPFVVKANMSMLNGIHITDMDKTLEDTIAAIRAGRQTLLCVAQGDAILHFRAVGAGTSNAQFQCWANADVLYTATWESTGMTVEMSGDLG